MKHPRRGSMLIEQVALLGVSSTIFLIAIGLLHQTLKYKRTAQIRTESVLATSRLAQQIRTDGLLCINARFNSKEQVELQLTDLSTARYRCDDGVVIREKINLAADAEKILARETYSLGSNCNAMFEVKEGRSVIIHFIETPYSSSIVSKSLSPTGQWSVVAPLGFSLSARIEGESP
jgi:hypothetical protein